MTTVRVGDLEMREVTDPAEPYGTRFEITRADPIIAVQRGALELIKCHMLSCAVDDTDPRSTFRDGVLTFYPSNRDPIIYREVAWDEDRQAYLFALPD